MHEDDLEPRLPNGESLDDFTRVIWKLRMLFIEGSHLINSATKNEERKLDEILQFTLNNQALILISKFLEIWDKFNLFSKEHAEVREFAKAIKPFIQRITKSWPKLRNYRNWVLAHPYSGSDERKIIPPWKLLVAEIAPTKVAETFLLLECARMIIVSTLVRFSKTYDLIKPTFDYGDQPEIKRGVQSGEQAELERQKIATELNEVLKRLGVDLTNPIFRELS